MFSDITDRLLTIQDAAQLRSEIRVLEESVFQVKDGNLDQVLKTKLRDWVATQLAPLLSAPQANPTQVLKDLTKELDQLPQIQVTLAIEPSRELMEKIHEVIATQLQKPVLLELKHNPRLIGGMQLTWQGKYADFSLQKQINQFFEHKAASQVTI